jgi:hypothetical protein
MQHALSYEQGPPLSVPLRFLLTAPLFGLAAGVLVFLHGPEILASRWSAATLALTHLLTLGYLALAMTGALFQILPVVAGATLNRPLVVGSVVHAALVGGTIALVAGFLTGEAAWFKLALLLLPAGFVLVLGYFGLGLLRARGPAPMLRAVRLSLTALGVTVTLGAIAASAFAWPLSLPVIKLTNLHAAWGLLGAVALLVIGVAYQVVPMFQATPPYPATAARLLAAGVFALLAVWSLAFTWLEGHWLTGLVAILVRIALLAFCTITALLLWRRRRPAPEPTTAYWATGLASLALCLALSMADTLELGMAQAPAFPLLLGVLFILGFACSVINGMLYKIVPFLLWYHLQERHFAQGLRPPGVKQVVPERAAWRQYFMHLAALLAMTLATIEPGLHQAAAVLLIGSFGWLGLNLANGVRVYFRAARASWTPALAQQG